MEQLINQLKMEAKFSKVNIHAKLDELLDSEDVWVSKISKKLRINKEDTRKIVKKIIFLQEWVTIPVLVLYVIKVRSCSYKKACKLVERIAKANLIKYRGVGKNIMIKCGIKDPVIKDLKQGILWHMYPPPMLVPPNTLSVNSTSPYMTTNMPFNIALNTNITNENKSDIYYVINSLNAIPLRLDPEVLGWDEHLFKPKKKKFKQFHKEVEKHKRLYQLYKDKEFYLLWKVDKRLRMYSAGNAINIQGYDYKRALINTSDEEVLTEEGLYWLKIAACNAFDEMVGDTAMSKRTYSERLEWTEKHLESVNWKDADKPFMFRKLRRAIRKGVGHSTGILVEFDASSSGSQILSIIAGCKGGMKICNLGPKDNKYADAPTIMLRKFNKANKGKKLKITRKRMKYAYMTRNYGSVATPTRVFGNKLWLFDQVIADTAPKMNELYETLMDVAKTYRKKYTVITPDTTINLRVYDKVEYSRYSKLFDRNIITYMEVNEPKPQDVSFTANFVAAYDAYIAREMIRISRFDILPIHDAFLVHANHVGELIKNYNDVLLNLNHYNKLKETLKSNRGGKFKPKRVKKLFNKYALS